MTIERAGVEPRAQPSVDGGIGLEAAGASDLARHAGFRCYWASTGTSVASRSMLTAALAWLALDVTGSELMLASVAAAQYVPTLLFSLVAGGIADRIARKTILVVTAVAGSGLAFGLGAADSAGQLTYWHLLVGSLVAGILMSLDFPARQALLPEIVSGRQLFAGISLTSATQQVAWFLGPLLDGAVAARGSMTPALLVSGALAAGAAVVLVGLHSPRQVSTHTQSVLHEIRGALLYARADEVTPYVLAAVAVMSLFIMNYQVFITALAQRTLQLGPDGYGLLMAAMGLGALLGAVWGNLRVRMRPSLATTLRFAAMSAALTFTLSFAGYVFVTAALVVCGVGAAWTLFQASAQSLVQDRTPAHIRGKVLSGYALLSTGLTPLGYALAGFVAQKGGVPLALAVCGACGLGGFVLIAIVDRRRTSRRAAARP